MCGVGAGRRPRLWRRSDDRRHPYARRTARRHCRVSVGDGLRRDADNRVRRSRRTSDGGGRGCGPHRRPLSPKRRPWVPQPPARPPPRPPPLPPPQPQPPPSLPPQLHSRLRAHSSARRDASAGRRKCLWASKKDGLGGGEGREKENEGHVRRKVVGPTAPPARLRPRPPPTRNPSTDGPQARENWRCQTLALLLRAPPPLPAPPTVTDSWTSQRTVERTPPKRPPRHTAAPPPRPRPPPTSWPNGPANAAWTPARTTFSSCMRWHGRRWDEGRATDHVKAARPRSKRRAPSPSAAAQQWPQEEQGCPSTMATPLQSRPPPVPQPTCSRPSSHGSAVADSPWLRRLRRRRRRRCRRCLSRRRRRHDGAAALQNNGAAARPRASRPGTAKNLKKKHMYGSRSDSDCSWHASSGTWHKRSLTPCASVWAADIMHSSSHARLGIKRQQASNAQHALVWRQLKHDIPRTGRDWDRSNINGPTTTQWRHANDGAAKTVFQRRRDDGTRTRLRRRTKRSAGARDGSESAAGSVAGARSWNWWACIKEMLQVFSGVLGFVSSRIPLVTTHPAQSSL